MPRSRRRPAFTCGSDEMGLVTAIIEHLHTELVKAVNQPDVLNNLPADGSRPMTQSPAEFGSFLRGEIAKWQHVANAAGIRAK